MTSAGRAVASDQYVIEAVRQALTTDQRTLEQGLTVCMRGDSIVITGMVLSSDRKAAVGIVARETASDRRVVNDVEVVPEGHGHEREALG